MQNTPHHFSSLNIHNMTTTLSAYHFDSQHLIPFRLLHKTRQTDTKYS
ncbi:hypothetical protein BSI_27320 [Bacillus inaquosorum KCTC 13429]|uniref:Uncharacterized protein n=1 Tax=Bacillus inaquosorum KCTC 13429 TaxID=1236548 RepID=A0A9W5LI97_9BACI|nr:hypothetical protein BSI_27320 [Bacillus inaquosorum KCTC 13429]